MTIGLMRFPLTQKSKLKQKQMKFTFSLLILMAALMPAIMAQEKPATADEIMSSAISEASEADKNILLMFHASWCGWCKKMDASIVDESCRDYFDNNFVVTHMVVKESPDKKHLENPGADEFLARYHGDRSGIPFWLIFNGKGELIADSFIRADGVGPDQPGSNIGCPAQDEEVAIFIEKLKMAAPMSDSEAEKISARFKMNRSR